MAHGLVRRSSGGQDWLCRVTENPDLWPASETPADVLIPQDQHPGDRQNAILVWIGLKQDTGKMRKRMWHFAGKPCWIRPSLTRSNQFGGRQLEAVGSRFLPVRIQP